MEMTAKEIAFIELTSGEGEQNKLSELNELQLALVGGGCGEVVFH